MTGVWGTPMREREEDVDAGGATLHTREWEPDGDTKAVVALAWKGGFGMETAYQVQIRLAAILHIDH